MNLVLNNQLIKEKEWKIRKYLERNKKENTTYQTYRMLLKGKLYSNNDYILKKSQINSFILHFKKL